MTTTAQKTPPETTGENFSSARNPNGKKKPVSTAAIRNENQRINVPYNSKAWDSINTLSGEDRRLLSWFHLYCLDNHLTGAAIGEIIGYDRTTAYRVLNGTYTAKDWSKIVTSIRIFQAGIEEMPTIGGIDTEPAFVHTEAAKTYWQAFSYAGRGGFSIIAGPSGSGKTKTSTEWSRQNPGRVKRINVPSVGTHVSLVRSLAKKLGHSWRNYSVPDILLTMTDRISGNDVLVFDQGSRLIPGPNQHQAKSLEVIMDLNEETGCGIVIPLTHRDIRRMGDLRYQIEQITGRAEIFCAADPTIMQVEEIADQFGKFSRATITTLHELAIRPGALRTVTKVLNIAARVADARGRKISNADVSDAIANRFERMGGEDPFDAPVKSTGRRR